MRELNHYLQRQARRDQRRCRLEDSLIAGRFHWYALYRMRFLLARTGLRLVLGIIELYFFYALYSWSEFLVVAVIRQVTWLGTRFWWGATESLREEVRQNAAERRWTTVRKRIDVWIKRSLAVNAVVVAVGVGYVASDLVWLNFDVSHAYVLVVCVRLTVELPFWTFHSGLYAIRRIYRPLWSLIVLDIVEVSGLLLLFRNLGCWSIVLMMLAMGLLNLIVGLAFTRRAYWLTKIPPIRWRNLLSTAATPSLSELIHFTKQGLASLATEIDSVVIVMLMTMSQRPEELVDMAVFLYVARPMTRANHAWAQLFYFDYVKLHQRYSALFCRRFESYLLRTALTFGAGCGIAAIVWGQYVHGWRFAVVQGLFVPFFMARAVLAGFLMQAFSYRQYSYPIKVSAALGFGLIVTYLFAQGYLSAIIGICVTMTVTVVFLRPQEGDAPGPEQAGLWPICRWLAHLNGTRGAVRLGKVTLAGGGHRDMTAVTQAIANLSPRSCFTALNRSCAVWFEPAADTQPPGRAAIIAAAGGMLVDLTLLEPAEDGPQSLRAATARNLFCGLLLSGQIPGPDEKRQELETVERRFLERFPNGIVVTAQRGHLPRSMASKERFESQAILKGIRRSLSLVGSDPPRGRFDVSAYAPGGEPVLIFAVPRTEDQAERRRWREWLLEASIRNSLCRAV